MSVASPAVEGLERSQTGSYNPAGDWHHGADDGLADALDRLDVCVAFALLRGR